VAVRPSKWPDWYDGSAAFAAVLCRARMASHGLCPDCLAAVAEDWLRAGADAANGHAAPPAQRRDEVGTERRVADDRGEEPASTAGG